MQDSSFNYAPFVSPIYDTILKKLTAQDQDLVGYWRKAQESRYDGRGLKAKRALGCCIAM